MDKVRVRFAPSPTGTLHIGGARTALFNWLFARHHGGRFVLRLEDTDNLRSTEDSAIGIIDGLKWLGLDWDEGPDIGGPCGPYRQSERLSIYQQYLQLLLQEGKAYYCFCTAAELSEQREKALEKKENYLYDRTCLSLSPEQIAAKLEAGLHPVIRLKVPREGQTVVDDMIRGQVAFDNMLLDDFIIAKSDGWPTYNFAVVIDDFTMQITHIIRAEEHLSNTPKQLQVYAALGMTPPRFAHVSMILAPDRSKLSKRHGATSVQEFRDEGYLSEALVNYLALLGWSPGENVDILPWQDMPVRFSLDNVSRSAAIYDLKKLAWMNGYYLAGADIGHIVAMLEPGARQKGWLRADNADYFARVIDLVRSRARTVNEILDLSRYFFEAPAEYDEKGLNKYFRPEGSRAKLAAALEAVNRVRNFAAPELEEAIRSKANELGLKAAELIHPVRLALTGRTSTPGLFEIMELLGPETTEVRIRQAINYI